MILTIFNKMLHQKIEPTHKWIFCWNRLHTCILNDHIMFGFDHYKMYVSSNANPFRLTKNMALFFQQKLDSNVGAKLHEGGNFFNVCSYVAIV